MSQKTLVDHKPNNFARGIERTRLLAGSFFSFGVVGSQQVFENITQQFRVEGNFNFGFGILFDGKIVAFEQGDKTFFGIKKQTVGHKSALLASCFSAETVVIHHFFAVVNFFIKALEQAAIQKWHN